MNEVALAVVPDLANLATVANREHELALEAGVAMVEHVIRAGEALWQAKATCERGEWLAWLEASFAPSRSTAYNYMRIAKFKDRVLADLETPTITDAIKYVRGQPRSEWLDPATKRRIEEHARRQVVRRLEARRALERREREIAARRVGGSVAESYSLIRRTAQILDRAQREAGSREARAALNRALGRLHEVEDEIVNALGIA